MASDRLGWYRIGEAGRLIGVSSSTLRMWERRGLIRSRRNAAGYRLYSKEDLARLARVRRLRDSRGVNLAGIAMILPARATRAGSKRGAGPADGPEQGNLGRKLRQLRRALGMSLSQVSTKTGLSPSFISMVERSMAGASIASLKTLAAAYGSPLRGLLGSDDDSPKRLVRARERWVLPSVSRGVKMEELAQGDRMMACHLVSIAPGAGSGGTYAHEGEEFIFVLRGRLEVTIDGIDHYDMHPGDGLYFESSSPYSWRNPGRTETTVLWVNTPPTF